MKGCKYDGIKDVTFDLSELANIVGDLQATDGDIPATMNFEGNQSYVLSVCGDVSTGKPPICTSQGEAAASCYQYNDKTGGDCHRCGQWQSVEKTPATPITLPNGEQLGWNRGLQLTYQGGSACHHDGMGRPTNSIARKAILQLECDDTAYNRGTIAHALEYDHCTYTVTLKSMYACPTQCPIASTTDTHAQPCGGHGHCGWDKTNKKPACFCDKGWTGDACTTEGSAEGSANGTVVGLLVVTFLVVLLLLGALGYLVKQIRAYRTDATNYMAIRGNDLVGNNDI
eukprot:g2191.t1